MRDIILDMSGTTSKKHIDPDYYRSPNGKTVHKSYCRLRSQLRGQAWLWAQGKTAEQVMEQIIKGKYGVKPCRACFDEQFGSDGVEIYDFDRGVKREP